MLQTRMSYIVWWIVVLMLNLCASVTAYAHSPYLDQQGLRTWIGEDGRRYQIGMIYGDGIFGPDPGRAVVLKDQAQIVADGPRSNDGYVRCPSERVCYVILSQLPYSKAVPDFAAFRPGRVPDMYPEYEGEVYGFEHRWLSPTDYFVALSVPLSRGGENGVLLAAAAIVVTAFYWFAAQVAGRVEKRWAHKRWVVLLAGVLYRLLWLLVAFSLLGMLVASASGFHWVHAAGVSALTYFLLSRFSRRIQLLKAPS